MKPELKTARLTLRPVSADDFAAVQKIFTDEYVRRYLLDGEVLEESQIRDFIAQSDRTFAEKNYGLWLIVADEISEISGLAGLWHFFDEDQPQLLYALLPAYTKRGFAAEAARRVIEYGFSELNFKYLDASCDAPNTDSQRVAEKLGMKKFKEETIDDLPIVFFRLEK